MISKFNQKELNIINNFIKIYVDDFKLTQDSTVKDIANYIKKNTQKEEKTNIFEYINNFNNENFIFDPLLNFKNTTNNYISYLSISSLYYNNFIIDKDKIKEFENKATLEQLPYLFHIHLIIDYIDILQFKTSSKIGDNGLILFPYIYKYDEIKNYVNKFNKYNYPIISNIIPYTDNIEFNNFMFELWNKINYNNYEWCSI